MRTTQKTRIKVLTTFLFCTICLLVVQAVGQSGGMPRKPGDNEIRPFSDSKPYQRTDSPGDKPRRSRTKVATLRSGFQPGFKHDGDVIEIDSTLVTIPVTVSDARSGTYISDLTRSDFRIFEDGVRQEIAYFGLSEKPLTVLLILDTSPSTEYRIEEIQDAALTFVENLRPHDRVEVIKFNEKIRVLARATLDRRKIRKAIDKARFDGGTSLYDVVDFAIKKRLSNAQGRKAVVLFTDGVDTTSEFAFYDDTVTTAENSDAIIFPVYYDTYSQMARKSRRNAANYLGKRKLGRMYLDELAAISGGRLLETESVAGGLSAAFKMIAEELRHQYNLGYYPIKEGKPGQKRRIKVRVFRPDLEVRARGSYVVK